MSEIPQPKRRRVILDVYSKKCSICKKRFPRVTLNLTCGDDKSYKQNCFQCSNWIKTDTVLDGNILEVITLNSQFDFRWTLEIEDQKKTYFLEERRFLNYTKGTYKRVYIVKISFPKPPLQECIIQGKKLIIPLPNTFYKNKHKNALLSYIFKKLNMFEELIKIILKDFIEYDNKFTVICEDNLHYLPKVDRMNFEYHNWNRDPTEKKLRYLHYDVS